jgi:hypothetical protein
MTQASKQFRRVNGHLRLAALRRALAEHVAADGVSTTRQKDSLIAA